MKLKATFRKLSRKLRLASGPRSEVQLERIQMGILEMEDVLFHLNSCVMMPAAPSGASSGQGGSGTTQAEEDREGDQLTFTGIRALAMVFRRLEMYPKQSILLAGHTDTSGGFELNYTIAHQRALNVRYLLEGNRSRWAEICQQRQKVEDHQQILKWLSENQRLDWDTDPGEVDDAWGSKTELALSRFVDRYNEHYQATFTAKGDLEEMDRPTELSTDLVTAVKNHSKHDWPKDLWCAVHDLYMEEMADALDLGFTELPGLRTQHLRFADNQRKFVACGESFPIDDAEKENYRSQKNRRVEVLFFDEDEAPTMECPLVFDRAHTATECPIWHKQHFAPVYLDPYEVDAHAFPLKFLYFDNVHGTYRDVPKGLKIVAFGKNQSEMRTRVRFNKGLYTVQILKGDMDEELTFGFETQDQYIYTADAETDPEIRTVSEEDFKALSDVERYKHHDLPQKWFSANWWTRYDGDLEKGEPFEKLLEDLSLPPHGEEKLAADKPLVFNLDDIVLLDEKDGTQAIQDADGANRAKDLDEKSRVKILRVDPETHTLKLYRKDPDDPKSARFPFPTNRVTVTAPYPRIVMFREGFYTVGRKRTKESAAWKSLGFVVGARAAIRDDEDHHRTWETKDLADEFAYTGDYQANYFHGLHMEGSHPTSYFLYYVSMAFTTDVRKPDKYGPIPTPADVLNFVDQGVYDAMDHWNHKKYWLDENPGVDGALRIRPTWVFEEKEHFVVDPADKPVVDDHASGSPDADERRDKQFQTHVSIQNAENDSRGGRARFLCYVTRDDNAPKKYGLAYHWALRNDGTRPYSIMKLNKSAWEKNVDGVLSGKVPVEEYGHKYGIFTLAHELGHATGQSDEYIKRTMRIAYTQDGNNHSLTLPAYDQFFECYTMPENVTAMMYHNGSPRLRYLWFAINYLQKQASGASLRPFLDGKKFTACFDHGDTALRYTRNLDHVAVDPVLRKPAYEDQAYQIGGSANYQIALTLHWVGQDEASIEYFHPGQDKEFQAVLCVRPKLRLTFVDEEGENWSGLDKAIAADGLDRGLKDLTGKYCLTGGTKDVKNVFVNFMGGFTDADHADTNHEIRYRRKETLTGGKKIRNSAGVIHVGKGQGADRVIDELFKRADGTNLQTALGFLKTWVDARLGDTFTLETL